MRCAGCGTDNPERARFCMDCGSRLQRRCPGCGEAVVEADPPARFCISCGHALTGAPAPVAAPPPPAAAATPPEERRWVTVLFADIAGYTAMSERMDPEAVREVADRCMRRLADEVRRFGGTIDKFIGDNLMALFGAPIAHEDDAERAVRCALAMQAAMAEVNAGVAGYGVDLKLRIGLNTGEVLAGRVGESYTVSGDAVNTAARLQSACATGGVTVGERTHRATRHAIAYRQIAPLTLKGKAEPVPAWEATGPLAAAPGRRDPRRETPLVGREEELRLLEAMYARVEREGAAALATVVGEAGVGKSRLLREMERRLGSREQPPAVREGRCLPYGAGIVFWALGEIVRAECGIADADPPEEAQRKLAGRLGALLGEEDPKVALVGRLLGIGAGDRVDGVGDAAAVRERFFSAVLSTVQAMARERPLVLAFEDIHWADEGMLDLIEYLARWLRAPVLIVCLAREQLLIDRPTWGAGRRGAAIVPLDPLQAGDAEALVAQLLEEDKALAPELAARSGGNPLFAEELVARLREEGGADASELPDTVHALLAARLDALPPQERRVVQHAAILGRTFRRSELEGVVDDVAGALAGLEAKDLMVAERGDDELAFKHVLIRDVAYHQLPKALRARKHYEVGGSIAARAGDRVDEVVSLLAEHHGRAAALAAESHLPDAELQPMRAAALRYLEAAGDATAAIYSNAEALGHFCGAAEFADEPDDRARLAEKAGDVALRLGRVDAAIEHWQRALDVEAGGTETVARLERKTGGALWHRGDRPGAIERYQAGITLLKDLPQSLELVRLYGDAASLYMQTGDNMLAIYAAEKALRLAEQLSETRAASRAHGIFGRVFGRMGDAERAREHLERSLGLARELDRGETILSLTQLAHHLELTEADYAGAEAVYAEALALAEAMGDVPAQVEIRAWLAQLALHGADWERVRALSDESAALSEREGLAGKLCLPGVLRGVLRWRDGDFDGAAALLRDAHEAAHRVGWSEVACAALLALATVERDAGRPDAAAATAGRAAELCERAGLTSQGVHAAATAAVALALQGRGEDAREAADRAAAGAGRVPSPACRAAAREAAGAAAGTGGVRALDEARSMWEELGRPLDAARCELLAARAGADPARLDAVRERYERLGVAHLAERAGTTAR